MFYKSDYLLNLIDTPGHIDFTFEVSRSLKACQGCLLIVDASQGIQAQTITNFFLAFEAGLTIIPVINKIDLKTADVDNTMKQLEETLEMKRDDFICISAKTGLNCQSVLDAIIERIPPPSSTMSIEGAPFKALVFDSSYDVHRGAIIYVACIDGEIQRGSRITSCFTKKTYEIQEVGIIRPNLVETSSLSAGQVGYIMCNMRSLKESVVGDTIHAEKATDVVPLVRFKTPKPMVYSGFYPERGDDFIKLRKSVEKLSLNDSSVTVLDDSSPALGQGYCIGFLGLLHMEIFKERLKKEYDSDVIITSPNVPYKIRFVFYLKFKF
jgi:translation factor GUF1, mitochondrial